MNESRPEPEVGAPGAIHSVEKAIAILRSFVPGEPELGVTELARRLSLHKSTVSRLLGTLERGGLVERNPDTSRYRLGVELIALAGQVTQHADLRALARPFLESLAAQCGETVNLVIMHQGTAMNIEQFVPAESHVKEIGWVGRRTPLHATSTGKVLLSFLPPAEQASIVGGLELRAHTTHTITDQGALLRALELTRRQGYAVGAEELETGLNSVAAPVRDHTGVVVAAVSISGPAYRVPVERLPALAEAALETAGRISRAMGFAAR